MIRCGICNTLVPRYPCQRCRPDKRNTQVARFVKQRDRMCYYCGNPNMAELDAGHLPGHERRYTGVDDPRFMRAECASRNRGGKCKPRGKI